MDQIVEYYKLCSIIPQSERLIPLINHIEKEIVAVIFTKKHVVGFLDERDGIYRLRESVIGADDSSDSSINKKIKGNGASSILVFV